MLTLLTPTALLALTGLLVPVAIHLWNRRPGREVAVGSLRWLAAGANRRLRNLKPEQLWLLLLRAALLAVLAVAVAGPVWRTAQPASRGVVLLSPGVASNAALATLRPTIDSLRRRGYALRWLKKGFPGISGARWRALSTGAATDSAAANGAEGFAWARVQQAAGIFPGQPLYVVTTAALRDFQGSHPPLPSNSTWQLLPDTATASWGQAAALWGPRNDSLRLLVGRSTATQTTFRTETIRNHNEPREQYRVPGLPPLRLDTMPDGTRIFKLVPVQPGTGSATTIDGPPQVIQIYASPAYASDARYLEAALRAAGTGLLQPPVLRRVTERPVHPAGFFGWMFWLSDEPLPKSWQEHRRRSDHLWREAAGPGVADTAQLATTETQAAPVTVFRRGTASPSIASQPVWADSRGRPLLSRQTGPTGTFYQLHTRLSPTWSTLGDDPQLPARLLGLLQPEPTDETPTAATTTTTVEQLATDEQLARHDQRLLDPAQLFAKRETAMPPPAPRLSPAPAFRVTDLRPWLVLLAGLLLLLERLLARRRESLHPTTNSL